MRDPQWRGNTARGVRGDMYDAIDPEKKLAVVLDRFGMHKRSWRKKRRPIQKHLTPRGNPSAA